MTPRPLQILLRKLLAAIAATTTDLEQGQQTIAEWKQQMLDALQQYHTAAVLAGQGSKTLTEQGQKLVDKTVAAQLQFLDNFAVEIQDAPEWKAGWNARAALYAGSIKEPYWVGKTKFLPLPAMPSQGTQCMSNCKCAWEVEPVDEAAGDYDAYWRRGASDSCGTCIQRERDWSPVMIRGGRLV
jgi:hypothetical protein